MMQIQRRPLLLILAKHAMLLRQGEKGLGQMGEEGGGGGGVAWGLRQLGEGSLAR